MSGLRLPEQNQVMLTGRLTRDPDIFFTQQGTAKCFFSIAVNQNYKDKASGEWKEQTSFVPVVVWREAAQRCKERLHKGSPVHVEGRLRSRDFEDKKTGAKRTVLEVEARRVQFLATEEKEASTAAAAAPAQGTGAEEAAGGAEIEEVPF
ncbi:MAG TPA: single-stranded DNA-binding protein [Elusimicrobiota bacterium]|nr:single-stranded DNA-binding protein [Elusimicrobiota bacterium]